MAVVAADGRGRKGMHRQAARGERAARIEAKPAKEQERRTDGNEWDIMHAVVDLLVPLAPAQDDAEDEGAHARTDVHHVATGKVDRAQRGKDATGAPHHVGYGVVDHDGPQDDEGEQRLEPHAPRNGARDEGGRDDGEHHLEEGVRQEGNRRRVARGVHPHPREAQKVKASDDATMVCPKGKREAKQRPHHHLHADDAERGHDVVRYVLASTEATVEEGEPWGHEEHERCTDQHESRVACNNDRSFRLGMPSRDMRVAPESVDARCHAEAMPAVNGRVSAWDAGIAWE